MKRIEHGDCVYFVGQNGRENWALLDQSEPTDMFIHLVDCPSCYVIITPKNICDSEFTITDILYGCVLCKKQSENKMKVLYTEVDNVKKGKCVGEVYFKDMELVTVITL